MSWTDEQVKILTHLDNQGLSYREIGDEMGITRGTVGGKLHRIAKEKNKEPALPKKTLTKARSGCELKHDPVITLAKIKKKTSPIRMKLARSRARHSEGDGVRLIDLRADQCMWIPHRHDGKTAKPFTCEEKKAPGEHLCQHHHNITHNGIPRLTGQKQNNMVLKGGQA